MNLRALKGDPATRRRVQLLLQYPSVLFLFPHMVAAVVVSLGAWRFFGGWCGVREQPF